MVCRFRCSANVLFHGSEHRNAQVTRGFDAAGECVARGLLCLADMFPAHHSPGVLALENVNLADAAAAVTATDRNAFLAQCFHTLQHGASTAAAVAFACLFKSDGVLEQVHRIELNSFADWRLSQKVNAPDALLAGRCG